MNRLAVLLAICLWSGLTWAETPGPLLDVAREIMASARYCALITVDEEGQPRARTVDPFSPEDDFTVWIATRPVTRKVQQIEGNDQVTLYYWNSDARSYVTLMGRAELIDDVEVKTAMRRDADSERLYPDFPADYLLIRFVPDYLEAIVPGYRGDRANWRPARHDFTR